MAPPKVLIGQNRQNSTAPLRKGIITRSQNSLLSNVLKSSNNGKKTRTKRKSDVFSPPKEKTNKRYAFTNITNAITTSLVGHNPTKKTIIQPKPVGNDVASEKLADLTTLKIISAKRKSAPRIKLVVKKDDKTETINKVINIRRSADLEKSEDNSLYVSALEDVNDSVKKTHRSNNKVDEKTNDKPTAIVEEKEPTSPTNENKILASLIAAPIRELPEGVQWDFDVENWLDPSQVSHYAMDIFEYLKNRERLFLIGDYMSRQVRLSQWMRALLVDWMVEVQESFELNHETLYLAVKLVDLYLTKIIIGKESLQLLGSASLFIASKYDCAKVSMPTLTLARYILEHSLMDYTMIRFSDSKMAAAALLLALLMKDIGGWNPTLEYYSGYELDEIRDICSLLNQNLRRKRKEALRHKESLNTIHSKYSHKIFFEVAKLPLKETLEYE